MYCFKKVIDHVLRLHRHALPVLLLPCYDIFGNFTQNIQKHSDILWQCDNDDIPLPVAKSDAMII